MEPSPRVYVPLRQKYMQAERNDKTPTSSMDFMNGNVVLPTLASSRSIKKTTTSESDAGGQTQDESSMRRLDVRNGHGAVSSSISPGGGRVPMKPVEAPQKLEWNEATFHLLHPQLSGVILLSDLAKEGVSVSEVLSAIAPEDLGSWPNTLMSAQERAMKWIAISTPDIIARSALPVDHPDSLRNTVLLLSDGKTKGPSTVRHDDREPVAPLPPELWDIDDGSGLSISSIGDAKLRAAMQSSNERPSPARVRPPSPISIMGKGRPHRSVENSNGESTSPNGQPTPVNAAGAAETAPSVGAGSTSTRGKIDVNANAVRPIVLDDEPAVDGSKLDSNSNQLKQRRTGMTLFKRISNVTTPVGGPVALNTPTVKLRRYDELDLPASDGTWVVVEDREPPARPSSPTDSKLLRRPSNSTVDASSEAQMGVLVEHLRECMAQIEQAQRYAKMIGGRGHIHWNVATTEPPPPPKATSS